MDKYWSENVQSINLINMSRMMIMNPDMAGFVADKLGIKPGMKLLDVGTGTGEFIKYLAKCTEDVKYYGIDSDENFIGYADAQIQQYCGSNDIRFIRCDAADLPFENESFDIVVSHTFLTAAMCYEKAFDEMIRVCRNDGIIGTINISDFSKMTNQDNGNYPWYADYKEYSGRLDKVISDMSHMNDSNSGVYEGYVMNLFSDYGLKDITVYPLGQFFSLSDSKLNEDTRRKFIEYSYLNDIERVDKVNKIIKAAEAEKNRNNIYADEFNAEELRRFTELALARKESFLSEINENSRWSWMGANYLFVKGQVHKKSLIEYSEADRITDKFEIYRETKYKACGPGETIGRIKSCLDRIGIETEVIPISSGVPGIYSCRVQIKGTEVGQNGKGTSPEYAYASGYAEFMERLQTDHLYQFDLSGKEFRAPDVKLMNADESIVAGGALLRGVLESVYGMPGALIPIDEVIQQWGFASKDGKFEMYPFTNVFTGKTEYLHKCILNTHIFTNGSCAGNTEKEAVVQGISEIMERYACLKILNEKLCAPAIPYEEIQKIPEIWKLYRQLKMNGDYDITLIDASLGKRIPAVGAIMINRASRAMRVKFGSHPRIETAIERTLTEMLQGIKLNSTDKLSSTGYEYEDFAQSMLNKYNILRIGIGVFPTELIAGEPAWEFKNDDIVPDDIEGQYEYLLKLCSDLGWNPYIRKCNFIGFDAYQIVIPEASVIFNRKMLSIEKGRSELRAVLTSYGSYDKEMRTKALLFMKQLNGYALRDNIDWAAGKNFRRRLFGQVISYDILHALEDINDGNLVSAAKYLNKYKSNDRLQVLAEICIGKSRGIEETRITRYLTRFYPEKYISDALNIMREPFGPLEIRNPGEECAAVYSIKRYYDYLTEIFLDIENMKEDTND